MHSFLRVFTAIAFASASIATPWPFLRNRASETSPCQGARVLSNTTIPASAGSVQLATFSCGSTVSPNDDSDTTTVTVTSTASPAPAPTAASVCGDICSYYCTQLGSLPPVTDDCAEIVTAISIFDSASPTFTIASGTMVQLTYGTCRFFFENLGIQTLQYCWSDLANQSSEAASTCFPPTQPVETLGLCIPSSGSWEVGVGHS